MFVFIVFYQEKIKNKGFLPTLEKKLTMLSQLSCKIKQMVLKVVCNTNELVEFSNYNENRIFLRPKE